ALDHGHPRLAIFDQSLGKSFPGRVLRPIEIAGAARFQKVLERIPCEFVRELECLNETLLLEFRQFSLTSCHRCFRQLAKSLAKALQALAPTDIGILRHNLKITSN